MLYVFCATGIKEDEVRSLCFLLKFSSGRTNNVEEQNEGLVAGPPLWEGLHPAALAGTILHAGGISQYFFGNTS